MDRKKLNARFGPTNPTLELAILGLIGVLMFACVGFMFYVVGKDKKKLAKWEALHEAE